MKKLLFLIVFGIGFSVFGEEAASVEKGSIGWEILHVFFVAFSGVLVAAAGLGIQRLFKLISQKWEFEGLNQIEQLAITAATNGIHYAETMAARKSIDSQGRLKATGSEKFDMAMQHIVTALGMPFVKQYGEDKLKKLIESALAQNDLGPAGS